MLRLPIDARRRVFVILVGDEFRTGDGTQAWAAQADLVLHPDDAARCEHLIRSTMAERKRLYQPLARRPTPDRDGLTGAGGSAFAGDSRGRAGSCRTT